MQTCMRSADTLARLGGDEFVVLQTDVGEAQDAISLAERLQEELIRPFTLGGIDLVHTSASIGIVLGEEKHERVEDILRDADIAMYQAKAQGKACFQVFDASMRSQVLVRVRLETELRQAIKLRELEVYYHPIIALDDGHFTGFEALVRWRHPVRGMISPAEFIPLAEESLLVIPLDILVLQEACRQVKEWQDLWGNQIRVSVNLSGRHFQQTDLVETIRLTLEKTGLSASALVVEITESAVMENFELATVTLRGLQQLGVGVEFDDFGKGQSSLTYLMELPVNTLKLDSSFINQIASDHRTAEIVRTIVRLGHNIGLDVVAEGVETEDQLEGLRTMGCDYAQGYLFAKPLDRIAAAMWMQEQWKVEKMRSGSGKPGPIAV
jgi:predicted signal transduction protein with EAL and GGDEF domain